MLDAMTDVAKRKKCLGVGRLRDTWDHESEREGLYELIITITR